MACLRRLIKSDPSQQKMEILERAVLRLAAKFEIQSHENKGLKMDVTEEKKCRKRGQRLNLLGEEETSGPQFFSPERVLVTSDQRYISSAQFPVAHHTYDDLECLSIVNESSRRRSSPIPSALAIPTTSMP